MKAPAFCPFSHRQIDRMCANPTCKISPFICGHCKNLCLNQHAHNGSTNTIYQWTDIEETMNGLVNCNGFVFKAEIDSVRKNVETLVSHLREVVGKMVELTRKQKRYCVINVAYRKTLERFKTAPETLSGSEVGRLFDVVGEKELLENQDEIQLKVNEKLGRVNAFLDDIKKKMDEHWEEEIKFQLKKGEEARRAKQYDEAINIYTDILDIQKDADLAYFCRGYVYDEMEDYNKALEEYSKAIDLNKTNPSYYNNRGIVLKNLARFTESVENYNNAIALNANNADYYFNRAIAYKGQIDFKKAEADFDKAIQLNPKSAEYFNGRGVFWKVLKDYQKAVLDYTKAIELNHGSDNYYANRAIAYANFKQPQKAIDDFGKAIALSPNDPIHYRNRYLVYEKMGKKNQAAVDKAKWKQLDATNPSKTTALE